MSTVLITGANRGIGLEFVKQYLEAGDSVIACCRDPESADELSALAMEHDSLDILRLDVTHPDTAREYRMPWTAFAVSHCLERPARESR